MARLLCTLTAAMLLAAGAAGAGEIVGTLKPAADVVSVQAADRDKEPPGKLTNPYKAAFDKATGEYRIRNLPAGTYDIILETAAGRIEGVNLGVEALAPMAKPLTLTPAELDRGEIAGIRDYLVKQLGDKADGMKPQAIAATVRETKMTGVSLVERPEGGVARSVAVPLAEDELPQVGEVLLGLISLAKVRDGLPRDYDLDVLVPDDGPGEIHVTPRAPELTEKDREWLVNWVDNLKIFENKKRVLDLDGNGQLARVLVEKIRDEATSLPVKEPTAFWRVEIFDFKKYYGGWSKEKYTVIVRQQAPIRTFRTSRWMFEKRLGGIRVGAQDTVTVPCYEIPKTLDEKRGRVPF